MSKTAMAKLADGVLRARTLEEAKECATYYLATSRPEEVEAPATRGKTQSAEETYRNAYTMYNLVRDATNCMVDMSRLINDACANVMAIMKDQR